MARQNKPSSDLVQWANEELGDENILDAASVHDALAFAIEELLDQMLDAEAVTRQPDMETRRHLTTLLMIIRQKVEVNPDAPDGRLTTLMDTIIFG